MTTIAIISLVSVITLPRSIHHINSFKLKTTAYEIQSALQLAQKLSIDESKEYAVEFLKTSYRVRHYQSGGKIVLERDLDRSIKIKSDSHERITYNRDGVTKFGKFVLTNGSKTVEIRTLIGTGRIQIIW